MTSPSSRGRRWSRPRVLGSAAAALVAVGGTTLALVLTGSGDGSGAGALAATPSATPSEPAAPTAKALPDGTVLPLPPTPEPTGPTSDADAPPPSLPVVALDEPAEVGNGISAVVSSLEAIEGTGRGPGNVAGPALRATVRITNGTADPVSLDAVAVDLASGAARTPASPLDDPSASPFTGTVAPGGTAEGAYVFSVPAEDRSTVTLSVGYQAGAPFLVFTGPAS